MTRIIFTGDFMRPSKDGRNPAQHYNIRWCYDLLRRQLSSATGLPCEMIAWNGAGVANGQLDLPAVSRIYESFGLEPGIESWAAIYDAGKLPEAVDAYLSAMFHGALVVAFELPPYLEGVLKRQGIPYVDVMIHPVRFLDDIFFGIRTSSTAANERLARYAIAEEYIATMAGLQTASARRLFDFRPDPDSALLLLQTRFDRTQIRDGRFIGALDVLDAIARIADAHATLYVKDHPLDKDTIHAAAVRSAFANVKMVTHNVYKLFPCEEIRTVATLSSSTGIEAPYFGKDAAFLYKPPNTFALDGSPPGDGDFVGVFDAALGPDFWRDVLSSILPTTAPTGVTVPRKPNRLRMSLKSFWSFNEIDTDYPVNLALGKVR